MSDQTTSLADLRRAVGAFVAARDWQPFHNPKSLSMSIAIEAAELMERFQWLTSEQSVQTMDDPRARAAVGDELADILIYCLSLSNALDLDVSSSVLGKLAVNETRYPVSEFRGRFRRPEREKDE